MLMISSVLLTGLQHSPSPINKPHHLLPSGYFSDDPVQILSEGAVYRDPLTFIRSFHLDENRNSAKITLNPKENCFKYDQLLLANEETLEWFIIAIIALYLLEQFALVFPIIGADFYPRSIFDVNLFLNVFC